MNGRRIGVYGHSSVGRDMLVELMKGFGAEVIPLGFSDQFIPVDTEAIRPEDQALAKEWVKQYNLFALLSADGDCDRPLMAGADGKWLRGDVLGILVAKMLGADAVSVPVSCNTAVEKSGLFAQVARTEIGSPFVDKAMRALVGMEFELPEGGTKKIERSVGWEPNGGFLTASDIEMFGRILTALPTRDAFIVECAALYLAVSTGVPVEYLTDSLPLRFTASGLLKNFSPERTQMVLGALSTTDGQSDIAAIQRYFGSFGHEVTVNRTDGIRMIFAKPRSPIILRVSSNMWEVGGLPMEYPQSRSQRLFTFLNAVGTDGQPDVTAIKRYLGGQFGQLMGVEQTDSGTSITFEGLDRDIIAHLRPSGNAPEFRGYAEAAFEDTALQIAEMTLDIVLQMTGGEPLRIRSEQTNQMTGGVPLRIQSESNK